MRLRFTTPSRKARWRWWVGTALILLLWLIGGSVVSLVVLPWTGVDLGTFMESPANFEAFPSWGFLLFALVSFIPLLIGVLVAYRLVLGVRVKHLFAARVPFRMWRVGWGAVAWIVTMAAPAIAAVILAPESFSGEFDWSAFAPFAVVAILLLPVQTTAEELFFRGWLIQGLSQRTSNIWILSFLSGLLFGLPHLANPEAIGATLPALVTYSMVGFALAWVTVRDRSLEIAIGAHAANNLFAAIVVGYEGGVLPAEAPFVSQGAPDWGVESLLGLGLIPLFIIVSRWGRRRPVVLEIQT